MDNSINNKKEESFNTLLSKSDFLIMLPALFILSILFYFYMHNDFFTLIKTDDTAQRIEKMNNIPEADRIILYRGTSGIFQKRKLPEYIQYVTNPSEKEQFEVVNQDGSYIKYIPNPTLAVQLSVVKRNGMLIIYIKNPSPEVKLAALENNPNDVGKYLRMESGLDYLLTEEERKNKEYIDSLKQLIN